MQPTEVKAEGSKQGDKTLLGHTDSLIGTKLDYLKSARPIDWRACQEVTKGNLGAFKVMEIAIGGPFELDAKKTVYKEHDVKNASTIDNERRSNIGPNHAEEHKDDKQVNEEH